MKKIFGIVFLLLVSFLLVGCNGSGVKNLKGNQLFEQEGKYLVFIHKDECAGCDEAMEIAIQYNTLLKLDEFKDKRKIYGFDVTKGDEAEVYRAYKGEGGQGTDGAFLVDGVTEWAKLYIGSTPALISVNNSGDKVAVRYIAQGAEAITESLTSFLN